MTRFWGRRPSASVTGENIKPLYNPELHQQSDLDPEIGELNASLAALVDVFPDIEPEVLREMLSKVSKQSRVEIVTELLLKTGGRR